MAYVVWGGVCAGGVAEPRLLAGAALACLLWGGLYALNDRSDAATDGDSARKRRLRGPEPPLSVVLAVLAGSVLGLAALRPWCGALALGAVCVQCAYTLEPVRLKRRPVLDWAAGAVLPALIRFGIGYSLVKEPRGGSVAMGVAIVVLFKTATYLYHCSRDPDLVPHRGTVRVIGPRWTLRLSGCTCGLAYVFLWTWCNWTAAPGASLLLAVPPLASLSHLAWERIRPWPDVSVILHSLHPRPWSALKHGRTAQDRFRPADPADRRWPALRDAGGAQAGALGRQGPGGALTKG